MEPLSREDGSSTGLRGLEHRGGFFWVDTDSGFVAGYEIELPDEDSYTSGRLELLEIERLDPADWPAFIAARPGG